MKYGAGFFGDAAGFADEVEGLVVGVARLDGLDEHGGELVGVGAEIVERGLRAVVEDDDVGGVGERNAGCDGSGAAGSLADQHFVERAVVIAGEVDEFIAAGDGAGDADGSHDGFGTGVAEGDTLVAGELAE